METEFRPSLLFSLDLCRNNCERLKKISGSIFKEKNVRIYFAVKANKDPRIQRLIHSQNIGAEVITDQELCSALSERCPMVVNGYYKSDAMIQEAIIHNVDMINVESLEELKRVDALAGKMGKENVSVGIRVQLRPNNKIGFPLDALCVLQKNRFSHCHIRGLHYHAGWNVRDDKIIAEHLKTISAYHAALAEMGFVIDTLNFGGSLCEPTEDPGQLPRRLKMYHDILPKAATTIHLEPGRFLVGNCGMLKAHVVEVRHGFYCLDSCAYGYLLTNATPRVQIVPKRFRKKDYPREILLAGHWPCEEDRLVVNNLEYTPEIGDMVLFNNFGAYCDEWRKQFEFNEGLNYSFNTNLSLLKQNLDSEEQALLLNHWDHLQDRLTDIPKKSNPKKVILKALNCLFFDKNNFHEEEINQRLHVYHDDFCMLRRDLVDFGYLKRDRSFYKVSNFF